MSRPKSTDEQRVAYYNLYNIDYIIKWDAYFRSSFGPNSEWGSIKTTIIAQAIILAGLIAKSHLKLHGTAIKYFSDNVRLSYFVTISQISYSHKPAIAFLDHSVKSLILRKRSKQSEFRIRII